MCISSSKIINHSLRSILVDGEYYLSTNDRLIQDEIAPVVSDKIRAALFFVEAPPQPLGGADDESGASSTEAPLAAREVPSPILSEPLRSAQECDARPLYGLRAVKAEVPSWLSSSNWSIPGQISLMLTLDAPPPPGCGSRG
jgi:hypothetical protein